MATQEQSLSSTSSTSTLQNPASETQEQGQTIPNRKRLIAQNLPWTCTSDDIRALFEKQGTVVDVQLWMYNKTKNKGLAFVEMATEEEAHTAISNLDSSEMEDRVIKVELARATKKQRPAETTEPVKKYNVFVGNLAWSVRSRDLREFFGGDNSNTVGGQVLFQSKPRRPAGYGFVSYLSKEEANAAIAAFNGKKLMGRPVRLGLSKKDVVGDGVYAKEGEEVVEEEGEDEQSTSNPVGENSKAETKEGE
ncbi:hypothetical protein ACLOJK_016388 [Asimina triloba]